MYNAGKPLPYLQLVTWKDYEEATEDRIGHISVMQRQTLCSGPSSGNENAVEHYTVYISSDGQNLMPNLMPLTDIATGVGSLNLCGFPIPDGNYKLFVQAIGKPSLANQITGAISYLSTAPQRDRPRAQLYLLARRPRRLRFRLV
jgi:hypothetical protein